MLRCLAPEAARSQSGVQGCFRTPPPVRQGNRLWIPYLSRAIWSIGLARSEEGAPKIQASS